MPEADGSWSRIPPTARPGLPPIIAFSNAEWGGMYSPVEPRLIGLAQRGWPVLHTNGPLSLWDRDSPEWGRADWVGRFERRDGVLLDRPGRWPPRWPTWERWDRLAQSLAMARLHRVAARSSGPGGIIAYIFHPRFYPYLRELDPTHVVFQVIDNYAYQPGWTIEAGGLLAALVERANLVLANNASQATLLPGSGPTKARVLSTAVDFERVAAGCRAPCPPDLARIPPPRIGYVGMINAKIDFPMIAEVARARPDWSWVLIGPVRRSGGLEQHVVEAAQRDCERLSNVYFLGYRDRRKVPAYLGHMQVNTICYRLSAGHWTRSSYPFKVLECLAVGRPVVSAAIPEVMRHRDVMDFADRPEEWIEAIDRALSGGGAGTVEKRQAVARANSWHRRIDELDRLFQEMVNGNRPGPQ